MKKTITISIGIPTYIAGKSLIPTLESIYRQKKFELVDEVIVVIDGKKKISEIITKSIAHPKLRLIFKDEREGQAAGINTLVKANTSDLFILTNDDVILDKNVIVSFLKKYDETKASLISAKVSPLKTRNLIEFAISQNAFLADAISKKWNNYENYLACNGRLLMLNRTLCKALSIPPQIWNNDAYIYFFSMENGFSHAHQPEAIVKYRAPGKLKEYLKQSEKFQFSLRENQQYFNTSLIKYFDIPKKAMMLSILGLLKKNIMAFCSYFCLLFISRIYKSSNIPKTNFWETDLSTKNI